MESLSVQIQKLRTDYSTRMLLEKNAPDDPFSLFAQWLQEAINAKIPDPNAFTLSTISVHGRPSSRIVLLRELDSKGFCFYTNYNSHKGVSLAENPYAAVNFFWPELERQIRIEGTAEKISTARSDAYFKSRPRESQVGAWASAQSNVLGNREELENSVRFYTEKFLNQPVPRPPQWGGFYIKPHYCEFWQGRANRLHDRLAYRLQEKEKWHIERLSP